MRQWRYYLAMPTGFYERHYAPIDERFFKHVKKTRTCWLWMGFSDTRGGYGRTTVVTDGKRRLVPAHRASWEIHFGPIPYGMMVCHICDVPRCVNPKHLFLGTNEDNTADRVVKGRSARGEHSGVAVLTPNKVRAIRAAVRAGRSMYSLAHEFDCGETTIRHVMQGRTWAHVAD